MQLFHIILFVIYVRTTHSSIYGQIKKSFQNLVQRAQRDDVSGNNEPKIGGLKFFQEQKDEASDIKQAHDKAKILQKARTIEHYLNHGRDTPHTSNILNNPNDNRQYFHMDPVLNKLRRRLQDRLIEVKRRRGNSDSTSSSREIRDWKEEFDDHWMQKKFEAVNSSDPRGDVINMAAARPWGVPCGDPNQHDMPWGSCMMSMECESEYRIYRGDIYCGRTQYVCCALQLTNYDFYQGFDLSFADTSFSTDSEERKARENGSKEDKKKKTDRKKTNRQNERKRRKRKIRKQIRKIVHEIRKILNRAYRNATHNRKKRTLLLKKYIKNLKKQYRKDRKSVRDIHQGDMEHIDAGLEKKLEQIKEVNKNFLTNSTFRDIIVNGTINRSGARMLAQAYPELKRYLQGRLRRGGGGVAAGGDELNDYLEYDIEYGALYY